MYSMEYARIRYKTEQQHAGIPVVKYCANIIMGEEWMSVVKYTYTMYDFTVCAYSTLL